MDLGPSCIVFEELPSCCPFFSLLAAAAIFLLLLLLFILFLPFEMESYSLGSPKNRYVVQTGATLTATLLTQSPKCWETPALASFTFSF